MYMHAYIHTCTPVIHHRWCSLQDGPHQSGHMAVESPKRGPVVTHETGAMRQHQTPKLLPSPDYSRLVHHKEEVVGCVEHHKQHHTCESSAAFDHWKLELPQFEGGPVKFAR